MNNSLYSEKESSYYSHVRTDIKPFIPSKVSILLDVGCSNGAFGRMLKHEFKASEVWGIEPLIESAQEAIHNLDTVITLPVEESMQSLPDQYFDCIFFNDVLEHLVDPYTILKEIKYKLKPNGYLIASIPNILHFETLYRIIQKQDWQYEKAGILDKTHLRFFTKKSIIRMFQESGLEVELIEGINPYYGRKFKILRFLLGKRVDDFKYIQFCIRCKVAR